MILTSSCHHTIVVTPKQYHKTYQELKASEPSCMEQLNVLQNVGGTQACLDTIYCYRSGWKYWENEYQVLDTQLKEANKP